MSFIRLVSLLTFTLLWTFTVIKPCMAQTEDGITHFRIGIVASENKKYRLEQVEPFRAFMEQQIALPVSLVPFDGYEDLIKAHHDRRIHYAVYSAAAYAQSWAECRCLEPLVAPRAEDGSYGMYSVLLVAHEAPYQQLEDLHGERVLYTGQASMMGHLIPARAMSLLSAKNNFVFERIEISPDLQASLGALQLGTAAAVFGWQGASKHQGQVAELRGTISIGEKSGLIPAGFARMIWRSEFVPHGPHAVSSDLPDALKSKLREALFLLDSTSQQQLLTVSSNEGLSSVNSVRTYYARDIIDAVDHAFGGGFAPVKHYEYVPVLNVIGWGTETIVPAWP